MEVLLLSPFYRWIYLAHCGYVSFTNMEQVGRWHLWDSNPGILLPESLLLTTSLWNLRFAAGPCMLLVGDLCGLEFQLLSWTWSGFWCSSSIWSPFRTISWKIPDCQLFHWYNPSPVKCVQLCVQGCAWTWIKVKLRKLLLQIPRTPINGS